MSGFLPSAEMMNIGLVAARVGLQINSKGVTARETRPVNASCKLQRNEAIVNEPPEPTAIMLPSLAPAIADFNPEISVVAASASVASRCDSSLSYGVMVGLFAIRLAVPFGPTSRL